MTILTESLSGSFGTMALGLQVIPVVSILIAFTNAIGAALWAVRLEYRQRKHRAFVAANDPLRHPSPIPEYV